MGKKKGKKSNNKKNAEQKKAAGQKVKAAAATPSLTDKINAATICIKLGQFNKAVELLEPIADKLPPHGKTNLAAAYNNLNQYDKTLALLEPLKEALTPHGKTNLAFAYNRLNQYDKTLELLEPHEEALTPDEKTNLASAYLGLGQYSKTLALLEPIKDELSPNGKTNLAAAYLGLNQDSKVIDLLEPGKDKLPFEGKTNLASAYNRLNQYKEIIELLEPAKDELMPDDKSNLASAYLGLDQASKAVELLEPLKEALPPHGKTNLASAYNRLNQYDKTLALLEPTKESLTPAGKSNLAAAYNSLNQYDKTLKLLEPNKDELTLNGRNNLAIAYINLRQYERAIAFLEPIKGEPSPFGKSLLALAYILSEQFNQAIEFVTETNDPVFTAMFITDLLDYFKDTLLETGYLPLAKEPSAVKQELLKLFFNTYLQLNLAEKVLCDPKQQKHLLTQLYVLALLKFDDDLTVSYYCSTKAYEAIFTKKTEDKKSEDKKTEDKIELQMSAVEAFNDPLEGEMLRHNEVNSDDEGRVFIKCFSLRTNSLNQFRLYGGENGQANGVSLVFKPTFFSRELTSLDGSADTEEQKLPLFRVCYLEPLEELDGYKIHGLATPDITSYLADNPGKKRSDYQAEVLKDHNMVMNYLEPLLANMGKTIYIPFLPYLFKDRAFLDEAECRIIAIDPVNKPLFKPDKKGRRVYLRYKVPIANYLKEVIFSPKNEEALFLSTFLPSTIPWRKSDLPYK